METIKSYSDLQQSKKLAEILPLESADMYYSATIDATTFKPVYGTPPRVKQECSATYKTDVPAWSLSALLSVLPKEYYPIKDHKTNLILGKPKDEWCVLYWDATGMQHGEETLADNPVDACVEMILKLHELKKL